MIAKTNLIIDEYQALHESLSTYIQNNPNMLGLETCKQYQKELMKLIRYKYSSQGIFRIYFSIYKNVCNDIKRCLTEISFYYIKIAHLYSSIEYIKQLADHGDA
jgi:hypothetical protein